jgi:hypothetical protein
MCVYVCKREGSCVFLVPKKKSGECGVIKYGCLGKKEAFNYKKRRQIMQESLSKPNPLLSTKRSEERNGRKWEGANAAARGHSSMDMDNNKPFRRLIAVVVVLVVVVDVVVRYAAVST